MKKFIVKDYQKLEYNLLNIDKVYDSYNIKTDINKSVEYQVGRSSHQLFYLTSDVKKLGKQLIVYFIETIKNFEFEEFYSKNFVDLFKMLVKSEQEFSDFIDMTEYPYDQFFKLSVYVCPLAFTSNFIKYIREKYLGKKIINK